MNDLELLDNFCYPISDFWVILIGSYKDHVDIIYHVLLYISRANFVNAL